MSKRKPIHHAGGSIYRMPNGNWRAQVCQDYVKHRQVCPTIDEAKSWIEATQAQLRREERPLDGMEIQDARRALEILPEGVDLVTAARFYAEQRGPLDRRPVEDIADEFIEAKEGAGLRPSTLVQYRSHMKQLSEEFQGRNLAEITTPDLVRWLDKRKVTGATRGNWRASLSVFFNWAIRMRYGRENPADGINLHATDQTLADIWPPETVALFMKTAETKAPDLCPYSALGFFAGIRRAEMLRLNWSAVSKEHVHIGPAVAKKRRQRYITIAPNLRAWLDRYAGKGPVWPMSPTHLDRTVRKVCKAAGIKEWPSNVMRHSFASYHLALNKSAPATAMELGHTQPDILYNHYRNLATVDEAREFFSIRPTGR